MPIEIIMPKLGLTMTEGTVVEWKKKEGDPVKKGDILFVLQTEKVTFEVESPVDGLLGKILVREKETAPVGGVVAYLLKPGESEMDIRAVSPVKDEAPPLEGDAGEPAPAERGEVAPGEPARLKASPLAKKMAKEYNLDLGRIKGTGPGGRITKEDVEKAYEDRQRPSVPVSEPKKEEPVEKLVPFTGMRRTIAKRMLASKVETAQTYMSNTVDATRMMEYRESLLPYIQEKYGVRVTITDIMMKITGAAIREHPIINTRWTEEGILYLEDVHMGMAMALDDGLIVPVIRDINKKGFARIALDRMALIRKGKEKAFLPDDI
ncbi:MAG: dihydrolipoamide acetyltransferase family protein, partial [Pseudomonadota bacterium]